METLATMKEMNGKPGSSSEIHFYSPLDSTVYATWDIETAREHLTPRQFARFEKSLIQVREVWTWQLDYNRTGDAILTKRDLHHVRLDNGECL